MKIKLDENLPAEISVALKTLGHDVQTVHEEGLAGAADSDIWEACQRERRFLLTQDLDFSSVKIFEPGSHAGILLVRLRSASRQNLAIRIQEVFQTEDVSSWTACFVVATERKVRVRRP